MKEPRGGQAIPVRLQCIEPGFGGEFPVKWRGIPDVIGSQVQGRHVSDAPGKAKRDERWGIGGQKFHMEKDSL